ncbi:hypothetical protein EJ04DRAFT_76565 [Polyplosphaeria fusca]|uniref:Uncharacterized protein n=1 Tax=Polyplosphaeria fusca TaxID=682080 RepID=A0A9P4UYH4_9PLEO|nr:hypothetical protein EJ04DRAFT_76565 [Polyplosphaeria fusca]
MRHPCRARSTTTQHPAPRVPPPIHPPILLPLSALAPYLSSLTPPPNTAQIDAGPFFLCNYPPLSTPPILTRCIALAIIPTLILIIGVVGGVGRGPKRRAHRRRARVRRRRRMRAVIPTLEKPNIQREDVSRGRYTQQSARRLFWVVVLGGRRICDASVLQCLARGRGRAKAAGGCRAKTRSLGARGRDEGTGEGEGMD